MCVQVVVYCNFWKTFYFSSVLEKKNALKSNFLKISGYTNVNITEEDFFYLLK